jgi:hypothetical protein
MEDEIDKKELKKQIKQALKYLIAEGLVVKVGKKYRMKTPKEQEKELKKLLKG